MAVTINADTTNGLVLTPDTSGEIKLQAGGADIATVSSTGIAMASGKTLPASALTGTLPAIDGSALTNLPAPAALSTASGSAPSYSARAWVNFDGDGTVSIRGSGNVSSITDNGTGDYAVNLTTAMPDTNYSISGASGLNSASVGTFFQMEQQTFTSTSVIDIAIRNAGGSRIDSQTVSMQVFR